MSYVLPDLKDLSEAYEKHIQEEKNIPICYITGLIRFKVAPPDDMDIAPKVFVGNVEARVRRESSGHLMWSYLAIVTEGIWKVKMTIGNIGFERTVESKLGATVRLNFNLVEAALPEVG